MTPEELSQLEELDRTAMPGPWRLTTQMGIPGEGTVYGIKCGVGYQMTGFSRPEAEMLVAMRNALPGLLREIREQAVTIESLQADLEKFYRITDGRQISGVYNSETDRRVEVARRYMVESIGCDQKLQRQQADIDRLTAALVEERCKVIMLIEKLQLKGLREFRIGTRSDPR